MLSNATTPRFMGLSYTAGKKWGTMLKGNQTKEGGSWVPKKEHQVALMLRGNKASVYVDGHSLGEEEVPLPDEKQIEFVYFCFGACVKQNADNSTNIVQEHEQESHVRVTNVFLYNRPLNST
ncbi:trans-sialidase, putative, partial [Trypanosoma cruzi marinkellei]